MKARATPRPEPTTGRYWQHEGALWMRFPAYHEAHALRGMASRYVRTGEGDAFTQAEIIERLPMFAATVGWCWWALDADLETSRPAGDPGRAPDTDALLTYGTAVLEELQDAGWSILDVMRAFTAAVGGINERLTMTNEAPQRAVFSDPPRGATTSSPSGSA